jgi:hypothetical protein
MLSLALDRSVFPEQQGLLEAEIVGDVIPLRTTIRRQWRRREHEPEIQKSVRYVEERAVQSHVAAEWSCITGNVAVSRSRGAALDGNGRDVVRARGHLRVVERAVPDDGLLARLADLGHPLAPGPHPHAAVRRVLQVPARLLGNASRVVGDDAFRGLELLLQVLPSDT